MEGNLQRARTSLYPPGASLQTSSPLARTIPPLSTRASAGHLRMSSDQSMASPPATGSLPARSSSAAATYAHPSAEPPRILSLEPLDEDDQHDTQALLSPTLRSSSSMQMRDLRDQMHDLKGRLSVLRDRTRDDTLRRRSLQSLRTPSPFTAAPDWEEPADSTSPRVQTSPRVSRGADDDLPAAEQSDVTSVYEEASELPEDADEVRPSVDRPRSHDLSGDESEASVYHETAVSHEDREDAFDYEHFFLHSAMGTINQHRLSRRSSSGSRYSDESVETTRAPPATEKHDSLDATAALHAHLRSDSVCTISTVETFATAAEGEGEGESPVDQRDAFAVRPITQGRNGSIPSRSSTHQHSYSTSHIPTQPASLHQPVSTPSIDARNTHNHNQRSFPLVTKSRSADSTRDASPVATHLLHPPSPSLSPSSDPLPLHSRQSSPVSMLPRQDRLLVERLVASVGKCVLGLQEAGPAAYESRVWRRRLDAARRVLEGDEGAV